MPVSQSIHGGFPCDHYGHAITCRSLRNHPPPTDRPSCALCAWMVSFTLCVCVYARVYFKLGEMLVKYVLLWTWWGVCSAWFPGCTRATIHNPSLHPIETPTPRCCPLHPVSNKRNIIELMACSHWTKPRPRPRLILILIELGLMMILGSGYSDLRPRPMQICIGSVHILSVSLSVSVSVLGSVNQP